MEEDILNYLPTVMFRGNWDTLHLYILSNYIFFFMYPFKQNTNFRLLDLAVGFI